MRILVSGSRGLIGKEVVAHLRDVGHHIVCLTRRKSRASKQEEEIVWDPETGVLQKEDFEGFDAAIHLAGENIAKKWWTKKQKKLLSLSRTRDTWLLSQVFCRLYSPPKVLICASAVGFYGDAGESVVTEKSPQGEGFLATLCGEWEDATVAIEARGTRVVHTRFGAVLSPDGGMFKPLLKLFRLGLGFKIKDPSPFISWVALKDVGRAIRFVLEDEEISGAVNVTSPHPLRQAEFAEMLAKHVGKPALLCFPHKFFSFVLGEMGKELFLTSTRAYPEVLEQRGFTFEFPTLQKFLETVS